MILLLIALASLGQAVPPAPDILADLAKAEARWKAQRPQSYEFTVERPPGSPYSTQPPGPASFQVTDRQAQPIGNLSQSEHPFFQYTSTVENLFGMIRTLHSTRPDRMVVQYDEKLGYPTSIYVDGRATITHDEMTIRVTAFKIVSRDQGRIR